MRLRGVHASYGKREVLHGVDLDLREGEVAALVGANGAGKSTLCRTIVGLHRESAGTTTIDGEPAGPKQRLRACSMVFQDVNYQLFADSVRTEVSFGLTDAEAPDAARVDEVLDGLGLAAYAETWAACARWRRSCAGWPTRAAPCSWSPMTWSSSAKPATRPFAWKPAA